MFRKRYYYLIKLQYLGFRYHGWQKQPDVLTVEHMVTRTLRYVLKEASFKVLASGRTDAKVSANMLWVELFVDNLSLEVDDFLPLFNKNLPQDIKALEMEVVTEDFNIIDAPKGKEYLYLFAYGIKSHPFAAPFLYTVFEELDIDRMNTAAKCFEGTHDFKNYTYKPSENTQTVSTITACEIKKNTAYSASFFPDTTYMLRVVGKGFKRHQIRIMMGALLHVGEGKFTLEDIRDTLDPGKSIKLERIVPASGLILNNIFF